MATSVEAAPRAESCMGCCLFRDRPVDDLSDKLCKQFGGPRRERRAYTEVDASFLNDEQAQDCKEAFALFDVNGDGKLTFKEFGPLMHSLDEKPPRDEMQRLFHSADVDGNGTIDFEEFTVMMARRLVEREEEQQLIEAFKLLDKDGDGVLTADELRHVMTSTGEPLNDDEVNKMIQEADQDGDGVIDYEEFVDMMLANQTKMSPRRLPRIAEQTN